MRYQILNNEGIRIIHVMDQNIFFGYDDSEDYLVFREGLEVKGIDAFVDLLIEDSNTAFTKFTAFNG
jgi:hypothetical protein